MEIFLEYLKFYIVTYWRWLSPKSCLQIMFPGLITYEKIKKCSLQYETEPNWSLANVAQLLQFFTEYLDTKLQDRVE